MDFIWITILFLVALIGLLTRLENILLNIKSMWLVFRGQDRLSYSNVSGCGGCLILPVRLIMEPLIILIALANEIGSYMLALGALAVFGLYIVYTSSYMRTEWRRRVVVERNGRTTIVSASSGTSQYSMSSLLMRLIFLIPSLYMWYLFFVVTEPS